MSDVNTFYVAIADSDGNFFLIDVISSEEHKFEADVTEFPVESGGDITDNVRSKPIEVTMECLVSDTPLATIARARQQASAVRQSLADPFNTPAGDFRDILANATGTNTQKIVDPFSANGSSFVTQGLSRPTEDCLAHLMKIRDARKPVTIITSLKRYENMVMRELTIPRATGRGLDLRFNVSFIQVTIIENRRYVRVSVPRATVPRTDSKPPTPASPNNNYNDSLPLFKVLLTGSAERDSLWYDTDIEGWRHGVMHDPPSEDSGVYSNARIFNQPDAARTGSKYSAAAEGWVFTKDRPYGVSVNDWLTNQKYDYEYKSMIADAYSSAPRDPDGDYASVSTNPYDPFSVAPGSTDHLGNDISNPQVKIVHGRLIDKANNPALRHRHR